MKSLPKISALLISSHLLLLSRGAKGAKNLTFSIDLTQKMPILYVKIREIREIEMRRKRKNVHFRLQN